MLQQFEVRQSHEVVVVNQKSVDIENCQGMGNSSPKHQSVNDQRKSPHTTKPVMEDADIRVTESL